MANPNVRPLVTTTYSLTETITATGCSNSNSVPVFILPLSSTLTQDTAYIRMVFDSVPYIFEGTVSSQKCYTNEAGNYIYTANNIQVSKVFRGNDSLTCGDSVDLITEGGQVGDQTLWISHNLELSTGVTGIFFCIPSNYPSTTHSVVNMRSYFSEDGVIQEFNDGVNLPAVGVYMMFPSLDSLYSFLLAQPNTSWNNCGGLDYEETVKALKNSKPKQVITPVKNTKNTRPQPTILSTSSGENLYLRIANARTVDSASENYFIFDIVDSATDNNNYFAQASMVIAYNSAAFGTDVVTNSNIQFYLGGAYSLSDYGDSSHIYDWFYPNEFQLNIRDEPSASPLAQLNPHGLVLATIKMRIQDCSQSPEIAFDDSTYEKDSNYFDSANIFSPSQTVRYSNSYYGDSLIASISYPLSYKKYSNTLSDL